MNMSNGPKGTGGNVKGKVDGTIGAGKTFDVADYPSTINFTSGSDENSSLVHEGSMSRRPGGSMRGSKWHTKCNSPAVNEPIFGKNGCPGKSRFES
jgi:hypothetical protein